MHLCFAQIKILFTKKNHLFESNCDILECIKIDFGMAIVDAIVQLRDISEFHKELTFNTRYLYLKKKTAAQLLKFIYPEKATQFAKSPHYFCPM